MKLNEINEVSVEKWWNEICGRGKGEKLREKPTKTQFRSPRNPHGVAETRTRDPIPAVVDERLSLAEPPLVPITNGMKIVLFSKHTGNFTTHFKQ